MFIKIKHIFINTDIVSHLVINEEKEFISFIFINKDSIVFEPQRKIFKDGPQNRPGFHYLSSEEYYSLKCFIRGDFCRNVC